MDISVEVSAAIRDKLPAAVGDALRERLNYVDKLEETVVKLRSELDARNANCKEYLETLNRYKNVEDREQVVRKAEIEIAQRMQALNIQEAVEKALEPMREKRISDLKEVTLSVFANAKYKYCETATTQQHLVVPVYGGSSFVETRTKTDTKTIVEENK